MAETRSMPNTGKSTPQRLLFGLLLLTVFHSRSSFSQSRFGNAAGFVLDLQEQPMAGVVVSLRNRTIGFRERAVTTDATGKFIFLNLPPAQDYLLRAAFPGFATIEIRIEIRPGRRTTQHISMRPERDLAEVIEVVGKSNIVQLEDTTTSTSFQSAFIEGLPVIGREYQDVLVLAPGVQDEDGDGNVNILGSRDRDVKTMVDGMDVTDPFTGKDPIAFNLEAIQELELIRAGAGAQYGGKSGGFVNIITKSGGNDFTGAFKFFLRGDFLDGDGAGSDPPNFHGGDPNAPRLKDVDFDEFRPFLSLGGAIVRDKLWYFVANEFLDIDTPKNTPTRAFATNFSGFREFAKLTWHATPNNKVSFSFTYDPFEKTNQGVDSITTVESGFIEDRQRNNLTLRHTFILSSRALLESTVSALNFGFDNRPTRAPDRNGNGIINRRPANLDRFDPDCTAEDPSHCDSILDTDGDGYITDLEEPDGFFAARFRDVGEDFNSDGILNSRICLPLFTSGPRICEGDRNLDGIIETRDNDFHREILGIRTTFGPHFLTSTDDRKRLSLAEHLSVEVDDFFGTHSLDIGIEFNQEDFEADIERRNILITEKNGNCRRIAERPSLAVNEFLVPICNVEARIPFPRIARGLEARADRFGTFVNNRYHPIPNLTVGLGVRFDHEEIDASGFTPFDPQREAALFKRVSLELGGDPGILDADPILSFPEVFARKQQLRGAGLNQFTFPERAPVFDLPELFTDIRESAAGEGLGKIRTREDFTLSNSNLSPRLSISWDPWANGKTKFFSTWGKFYDNLFLQAVIQEEAPAVISRNYAYDYDGLPGPCDFPLAVLCDAPTTGEFNNFFGEKVGAFSSPSIQTVDRNLKSPHANEFTLGFEREIAPEFAIGVTYVRRKWVDQLQDTDINHLPLDTDILGSLIRPCPPRENETDPPCQEEVLPFEDGLPDLSLQNFFFNQILLIGNFNQSDYEGVELTFTRRLHRNWQMEGSYTYSRTVGAAKDFLSELGNDPAATENEFGFLDFDQRHTVKFTALTHLPRDFTLAGIATWSSGYPFSLIRERSSFDDHQFSQFRRIFPTGRRNDQRNDGFYNFNVSLSKAFVVGDINARLRFDVENLLNADDLRVFDVNRVVEANQVRSERRFGRRFELGFEMHF